MSTETTTPPRVRVLIVEDQTKILKNQLKLFEDSTVVEIVATAMSGESGLEEVRAHQPEVVLLDLGLPRMSGIDVTRAIKAEFPRVEILIFTIFDEEEKVLEAVQAGASGYLLKGMTADKIIEAILEVHAGGTVIQPNLARRLLKHFRVEPTPTPNRQEEPPANLSSRETEILQLIAKGISNSEAAHALNLSKATIRTHLEHIYKKLEVTNRVEAVTEGLRKGLIQV